MIFDIIKIISLLFLCSFQFIKNVVASFKNKRGYGYKIVQNMMYLSVFVVTIIYSIFHFHTVSNTKDLLKVTGENNIDNYIDLYSVMRSRYFAIQIESFMILFQFFLIIRYLRIFPIFNLFFKTIRFVTRVTAVIFLFMLVVIFCLGVLSTQIWGTSFDAFKKVFDAFLYIILIFELRLDQYQLFLYNNHRSNGEEVWEGFMIFFLFCCIIGLYITTAVVISAFNINLNYHNETERLRKSKNKYPCLIWIRNILIFKRFKNRFRRKHHHTNQEIHDQQQNEVEIENEQTFRRLRIRK